MNARSSKPDLLAVVGASADLPQSAIDRGYDSLATSHPGVALWTRSDERRIGTQIDGESTTAFFGVTTKPNPVEVIGALAGDLGIAFSDDPFVLVGHFAAVRVAAGSLLILTDHLGTVPVYWASPAATPSVRIVGTDLADVAMLAGRTDVDSVSAFEFVHAGMITASHTIFADVSRIGPATVSELSLGDASAPFAETRYWMPGASRPELGLDDAASELSAVMRRNLGDISSQYRRLTLLMSGGEDSRILANALRELHPHADDLRAVIFSDGPNREWRLASTAARMIGIELTARVRSEDHYTKAIPPTVSLVGGGIDLIHAHSIGLIEPSEADLFIDGWAADSIYKAHTYPKKSAKIGRVQVGLEKPALAPSGLGPDDWIHHEAGSKVLARREAKRAQLLGFRTPTEASAWMSLWPISDHPDYGFFASNWRSRPSASPFLFGNAVSVASAVPVGQLLNRRLFHRAFASSLGRAGWVPRTAGQIPRLGARSNLFAANVTKVVFRVVARVERWRGATVAQGPWQSFVTRQAAVRKAMASAPPSLLLEADRLARGASNPSEGESSLSEAIDRWSTDQSNRVLQLAALLDQVQSRDV